MLENVGPCTWGTSLAITGPLLGVLRNLLSGLLAEGQEEVRAQWLGKVHLQVCLHEQLEDIIANCLRREKERKISGETQRTESRERRKRNCWQAREMEREVEGSGSGVVGAGRKRPGGDREQQAQGAGRRM